MIYIALLAIPPSYAGHNFNVTSKEYKDSGTIPRKFVHLGGSSHQVTQTCRQIYKEAHPIFFASKAYYFAKPQEVNCFRCHWRWSPPFRTDTVTALCLKDLVENIPKQRIHELLSDSQQPDAQTQQETEVGTFKNIRYNPFFVYPVFKNLRMIALCFPVGEEMLYIDLLYCLSGMRRGLVEFVDASHWLIREQKPGDAWSIQYACFFSADYCMDKDNSTIPFDRRHIISEVTDIDSRAPGLTEGDERFVEVQIQRPFKNDLAQEPFGGGQHGQVPADQSDGSGLNLFGQYIESPLEGSIRTDMSDIGEIDLFSGDPHESDMESLLDQAEEDVWTDILGGDDLFPEVEPSLDVNDGSRFRELDSEESRDSQVSTTTNTEEGQASLRTLTEEVSDNQPDTQTNLSVEDPPVSSSSELILQNGPTSTGDDREFLVDTGDQHNDVEVQAEIDDTTAHADVLQHIEDSSSEDGTGIDQVQQSPSESNNRTSSRHLSISGLQKLPVISNTPCPYTAEEMEDYKKWQQRSRSGFQQQEQTTLYEEQRPSPPIEKITRPLVKTPLVQSPTATPLNKPSTTASQDTSMVLACASLLLLLILAIIAYIPRSDQTSI